MSMRESRFEVAAAGCWRREVLKLEKSDILENSLRIRAGNTKKRKERLC